MSDFPGVHPSVGVSGVVFRRDTSGVLEVALIERGKAPSRGKWTLPGGALELGEGLREAVAREVFEEVGLDVSVGPLVEVVNAVVRRDEVVAYHYVIVDYLCALLGGTLRAGSDAADARWVPLGELDTYELVGETGRVIQMAAALFVERERGDRR